VATVTVYVHECQVPSRTQQLSNTAAVLVCMPSTGPAHAARGGDRRRRRVEHGSPARARTTTGVPLFGSIAGVQHARAGEPCSLAPAALARLPELCVQHAARCRRSDSGARGCREAAFQARPALYSSNLHNLHTVRTARNARTVCSAGLHHPGHQRPIWTPQARLDAAQVGAQVRAYDLARNLTEYSSGSLGFSTKKMAKNYFPQALWNSFMGCAQLNKRALAVGLRRPRGKPL